ncbi:MAG: filamentous hemagglutinin N-terminal domain-containing protein, partial [Leptolyngbya sp. RL_3_1]|nr:filamentous hemagglutinin N-terminal domain-containing protein [Leptolyngbya sp. RL_3_1]
RSAERLWCQRQFVLLNPAGVLFGPNSALNLGGSFTATTADSVTFGTGNFGAIATNDYGALVGDPTGFTFSSDAPGSIVNGGNLAVSPGETLQLIGGQVINTGTLAAPGGAIVIAAVEGENRVRIAQDGLVLNLEVATLPNPSATPLPFTPLALPELLTGSGLSDAVGVLVNPNGTVSLTGSAVAIPTQPGIAVASGELLAAGGQVDILGDTVAVIDALVDAAAEFGGGQIRVGGDYLGSGPVPNAQVTYVDRNSVLNANATVDGDGGRIILWSDQATYNYSSLSVRGGVLGGDGGFVETSSAGYLDTRGAPDIGAPAGQGGTWLIDPPDINIGIFGGLNSSTGFVPGPAFSSSIVANANPSNLDIADLDAALASSGTVTVATTFTGLGTGNITFANDFTYSGVAAATLNLFAAGDINFDHAINSGAALNLIANAAGNVNFNSAGTFAINTAGGDVSFTGTEVVIGAGAGGHTINSGTGNVALIGSSGAPGSTGIVINPSWCVEHDQRNNFLDWDRQYQRSRGSRKYHHRWGQRHFDWNRWDWVWG